MVAQERRKAATGDRRPWSEADTQHPRAALAAAYPLPGTVVEVGGGRGGLLSAILHAHRSVRGVLFEQPAVLQDTAALLVAQQMARYRLVTGDFFASVPGDADVYVLKRLPHDWADEDAVRILRGCRASLQAHARLLVIDAMLKPGNEPDPNKMLVALYRDDPR